MKQCPACHRTYLDDAQLFCLEDGSQLIAAGSEGFGQASLDPNATLAYSPTRETNPPPESFYPQGQQAPLPSWSPTPYAPASAPAAARTGNRAWIIIAIAGVIVLGIGIVVLLAVIGKDGASNANENSNRRAANTSTPPVNANNTNRNTPPASSTFLKDDFSTQNWPTGDLAYGSYYQDGEYYMKGKPKLYVFMFPLNSANYGSKDASVKVTARSVDGKSPEYGYGLIIHGKVNQKKNLEGYGFLIYTGATPMYEIVRFVDGEPTNVVNWTESNVIRSGTNSNQIEVRAAGSHLSMYVNGQFIKSITDTTNQTDGFVGLYTSEINEVAFDDMEISRE